MKVFKQRVFRLCATTLMWLLQIVLRLFGNQGTFVVRAERLSVLFEGSEFDYSLRNLGATGGIELDPYSENATRQQLFAGMTGKDVFYDIGAHGGLFTITATAAVPGLTVVPFEPQPGEFIKNLRLNGIDENIVNAVAVGEEAGEVKMTSGRRSSNHVTDNGDITVPIVRLDDYCREKGLPDPTWIKIDIEGLELKALKGLDTAIARSKPVIVFELNDLFDRFGVSLMDWAAFAERHGYKICALEGTLENTVFKPFIMEASSTLSTIPPSMDYNYWLVPAHSELLK